MEANIDTAVSSRCLRGDIVLDWSEMGDEDITRFVRSLSSNDLLAKPSQPRSSTTLSLIFSSSSSTVSVGTSTSRL
jgi:hypothetical protein